MNKQRQSLILFLVATFVWTWGFYAPIAIGQHDPYAMPWMIFFILGGMGPSVVGVALVFILFDKEQRIDYFRRCFSVKRIGASWWVVILLTFPIIFGIITLIGQLFGDTLPQMKQFISLMASPLMWPLAAFISFMSGPWSEEFGWRGFALDRFLYQFGVIKGAVGLGLIWAVWHLPLYWMPTTWHAQMGFQLAGFWSFIALNVGLSLIMTWVYLSCNRSILTGLLLHFASNFTGQLFAPVSNSFEILRSILIVAIGLLVCLQMSRNVETQRTRAAASSATD